MGFENKIPDWENTGTEPTDELKETGFTAGYKPPAAYFNWFFSLVSKCVKEIQTKFKSHADNKENPHEVTAVQVGAHDIVNRGTLIPQNSDLDNYTRAGDYYSPDATTTNTLINSPVAGKGFKMTVEQMYGIMGGHLTQTIVTWNHAVYYRQFSSDTWGEWVKSYDSLNAPTAAEVDSHALSERGELIPASSNLDDYKTAGDYFVSGATDSKTITNSPMTGSGYRLIVEAGYVPGYIRQYAIGVEGNIRTRYYQTSWTPWMKIVTDTDMENSIHYHATKQLTNEDLDSILTVGHYFAAGSNTCTNSPAPSGSGFGLEVVQVAGGYYTQICFVANIIHVRYYNGTTWSAWQNIYSSNNFPVVPVNKGGTGAATADEALKNLGIVRAIVTVTITDSDNNPTISYPKGFTKNNTFFAFSRSSAGEWGIGTSNGGCVYSVKCLDEGIQIDTARAGTFLLVFERIDV